MRILNLTQVVILAFAFMFFPVYFSAMAAPNMCGMSISQPPAGCPEQVVDLTAISNGTLCEYSPVPCNQPTCPCTVEQVMKYRCLCSKGYGSSNPGISKDGCTCVQCPANTYSLDREETCNPCSSHTTSKPGSGFCSCAKIGYYDTGVTCIPCPVGAKDIDGNNVRGTTTGDSHPSDVVWCFLPGNTNYYDTEGQYIYADSCYYDDFTPIDP